MTQSRTSTNRSSTIWKRRLLMWVTPLAIIGSAVIWKNYQPNPAAEAAPPTTAKTAPAQPGAVNPAAAKQIAPPSAANLNAPIPANINGEEISRTDLARESMSRFGKTVVENLINKALITHYCAKANIIVTDEDVRKEIDELARKFGMSYPDYIKMLTERRSISETQYADDVIWPMIALKKLANAQVQPSQQELAQAYEAKYGAAVKVRIIVLNDPKQAEQVRTEVLRQPEEFGNLARKYSQDPSAGVSGMIQPIRRTGADKNFEEMAFSLKPGQVSPVVNLQLPGAAPGTPGATQFVIMICDTHYPAQEIPAESRNNLLEGLRNQIVQSKLQKEAATLFDRMEKQAEADRAIVNIYNHPDKRSQNPGVVASVYQQQITLNELSEACIKRHGIEVLESLIHQRLLLQALKEKNLQVTQDDIDTEIAHAAILMGKLDAQGRPDTAGWKQMVLAESGVSEKVYIEDSVWPSVALKKLTGKVEITQEDLERGFAANYGQRVRCRAIVQANFRKAQEVWEMARQNPTIENFGQLAEQYSIDSSSKAIQGRIPAIARHGGQPLVEKEVFALKPGQLSGIITLGDSYAFFFCEGFTEPVKTTFEEVKQDIYNDVFEKKQRVAMHKTLEEIKERARIDNYLAGTTHTPNRKVNYQQPAGSLPAGNPQMANPGAAPRATR
jgi:parvulin-like peptidyl-prolyl isomerase